METQPLTVISDIEQTTIKHDQFDMGLILLQHIESQINRVDIKAELTLTVNALLLASTTYFGGGIASKILASSAFWMDRLAAILSIFTFVLLLFSTYYALLAITPKLSPPKHVPENYFYFGSISNLAEQEFINNYSLKQSEDVRTMMLSEVHALASIAHRKFSLIRSSHLLLFFTLTFWAISHFLSTFSK